MKRFILKSRGLALILALGLCMTTSGGTAAWGEEQDGGVPGDWLSLYSSARSTGVGGAFVAVADEPLGAVWNPSGFSQMFQNAIHVETVRLFEGTSVDALSFAMPGRSIPSFGLTVLSLRSGEFERTNDLNESLGTFSQGEMAFLFSAAKSIGQRLTVGANAKIVRQTVDVFSASGVGMDVGLMYNVTPSVRVGASVMNVAGPTLTLRNVEETYPMEFRGGVSAMVLGGRGLVSVEVDHRQGPGLSVHAGTEYWVHPMLALRFGMYDATPTGGVSARIAPNMRLDYGMSNHELGVTHRIGLSYEFGGFFASSEATPPVFSPIGEQSVTKISLKARAKADISTWRLEFLDKSSQVVRRFSGKGAPPAHVMWDGKSEQGLPLPDGTYRYSLVVVDDDGREITGRMRSVEITTAGPQGSVPVVIE